VSSCIIGASAASLASQGYVPHSNADFAKVGWNVPPAAVARGQAYGGQYQTEDGFDPVNNPRFVPRDNVVNPFTSDTTCPAGFEAVAVNRVLTPESGRGAVQYECRAPREAVVTTWTFGGKFQVDDCGAVDTIPNPFTGAASCPDGYSPFKIGRVMAPEKSGKTRCGVNQYVCSTGERVPGSMNFFGSYQVEDTGTVRYGNDFSAGATCPQGSTAYEYARDRQPETGNGQTGKMCLWQYTPGGGSFQGCRGNGLSVCAEAVTGYQNYFVKHPDCFLNKTCGGRMYSCNSLCPAPAESDR
jgi:hypothetical protein